MGKAFILGALFLIPLWLVTFHAGAVYGRRRTTTAALRSLGFTRRSANRHLTAMALLRELLVGIGQDVILSTGTRARITLLIREHDQDKHSRELTI